jgi:cyanophycinase
MMKLNNIPVPNGILLVIGGSENKGDTPEKGSREEKKKEILEMDFSDTEVLETFIKLIGKEKPLIEVITTAGGYPEESFADYQKIFHRLGVEHVGHIHHYSRKELLEDSMEERVAKADAFFFSGGDQLKLTSTYGGTTFLSLLKQRYINDTIVIGGTSAGAMAMSTPMIYSGHKDVEEVTGEIRITTGLQFLNDVCVDTHFVHRGRFVRMAQVIVTNPACVGLGIEEDTAVIVRKGREAEVIGSGTVIVMDGFHIGESNVHDFASKQLLSMRDLRVHILSRGDEYTIPLCNPPHL